MSDFPCRATDLSSVVDAVSAAVRNIAETRSAAQSLQVLTGIVVRSGLADTASVTVLHPDKSTETLAPFDELASAADQLQYTLGEGPCLEAAATDRLLSAPDLSTEDRWVQWSAGAVELGVRASLSVPLATGVTFGSLNIYSLCRREFDPVDLEAATLIASQVTATLANARVHDNLRRAIESRNLIGRAQGILMERHRLTAQQAFAVLSNYSQQHNAKLTAVAEELSSTGILDGLIDSLGQLPRS